MVNRESLHSTKSGLVSLALILFMAGPTIAGEKILVDISPVLATNYGHTRYFLKVVGFVAPDSLASIRSELIFPLNQVTGGIRVGVEPGGAGNKSWSMEFTYMTAMNDPRGPMEDSDWLTFPGVIDGQISYTQSMVEAQSTIFNVEGSLRLLGGNANSVGLLAGFRYQQIKQDVFGYDGWQLDFDTVSLEFFRVDVSGQGKVGYYEITYRTPHLGLYARLRPASFSSVVLKAQFAPMFFDDFDDHLLRKKTSEADGSGTGLMANARFGFSPVGNRVFSPFVSLEIGYVSFKANATQVQKWYGDDPASLEDDTGETFGGIPYEISSVQLSIGLSAGVLF